MSDIGDASADDVLPEDSPSLLLVEDDDRLGTILATVLAARGYITHTAHGGRAALRWLGGSMPALAIIDLGLPDIDGLELLASMRLRWPELRVLVLTVSDTPARIVAAMRAGATGYLVKDDAGLDLVNAVEEALAGGAPMSRTAARAVVAHLRDGEVAGGAGGVAPDALTGREREVLQLLARGLTYDEAAGVMRISTNTIRTHVRAIYEKLDAASRTEAIITAMERGLVSVRTRGIGSG